MPGNLWDAQATGYADARQLLYRPSGVVSESYSRDLSHQLSATTVLTSQTLYLVAVPYQKGQLVTNIGFAFGPTVTATMTRYHYSLYTHDTFPYLPPIDLAGVTTTGQGYITVAAGVTQNMVGRLITGTGIPAGTYTTTGLGTTILSFSAGITGTGQAITATLGQYRARARIVTTGNITTPVPTVSARQPLALTGGIDTTWTCPATGLYYHGIVIHATTMPDMIQQMVGSTSPTYFYGETPIMCGSSGSNTQTSAGNLPAQATAITAGRDRLYTYST